MTTVPGGTVLLTGATGFTGGFVLRRLLDAGYRVTIFARDRARAAALQATHGVFAIAEGRFEDRGSFAAALQGHDILVNVASLGFGHAPTVLESAQEAGVRRAVFFSTTAIFTTLPAPAKATRLEAEDRIRQSTLDWTIIRPTMIAGTPADRNLIRLIRWVDRHKIVPVFGPGTYRLQPVYVDDLADAVVRVLASPITIGQAYDLSGGTVIDYNELVGLVARLLKRRPRLVHLPVLPSLWAVRMAARLPGIPRISAEQVLRLNEHKDFDHRPAARDFGYAPAPLPEYLEAEVAAYRRG
jgi:uncharacterized protein YbjT (DUF2867 family)